MIDWLTDNNYTPTHGWFVNGVATDDMAVVRAELSKDADTAIEEWTVVDLPDELAPLFKVFWG